MAESTPLTAAERDYVRTFELPTSIARRLLAECDALAAQLAALETQYHADSDRWIAERNEALGIAWMLAIELREVPDATSAIGQIRNQAKRLALAAFDALHWPDPTPQEETPPARV